MIFIKLADNNHAIRVFISDSTGNLPWSNTRRYLDNPENNTRPRFGFIVDSMEIEAFQSLETNVNNAGKHVLYTWPMQL